MNIDQNTVVTIVSLVLGSSFLTVWVTKWFERKQTNAGTIKLRNESGQIVLEGELKVTEFYKKQLEAILEKYNNLEQRLNNEIKEHQKCEAQIQVLTTQYLELQRQFTLFKTQVTGQI